MRAKTLEELRKTLLYQNTVDVWMTLCTEKGWEWRDADAYQQFIDFLRAQGVSLATLKVKHSVNQFAGKPVQTYSIRLDDTLMPKVKEFKQES